MVFGQDWKRHCQEWWMIIRKANSFKINLITPLRAVSYDQAAGFSGHITLMLHNTELYYNKAVRKRHN